MCARLCHLIFVAFCLFEGDATGSDAWSWIGLFKLSGGQWKWVSTGQKAGFIPWAISEPSSGWDEKYGCYILKLKALHDCSLYDHHEFMCEI